MLTDNANDTVWDPSEEHGTPAACNNLLWYYISLMDWKMSMCLCVIVILSLMYSLNGVFGGWVSNPNKQFPYFVHWIIIIIRAWKRLFFNCVNACVNIFNRALTHILSMYIFQVGVIQQLYGRACLCWMQGSNDGAAVKFHQVELDSWETLNTRLFVSCRKTILQSKISVLRLELILTIKGGFWCNIAWLFYGTVLKFFNSINFSIRLIP